MSHVSDVRCSWRRIRLHIMNKDICSSVIWCLVYILASCLVLCGILYGDLIWSTTGVGDPVICFLLCFVCHGMKNVFFSSQNRYVYYIKCEHTKHIHPPRWNLVNPHSRSTAGAVLSSQNGFGLFLEFQTIFHPQQPRPPSFTPSALTYWGTRPPFKISSSASFVMCVENNWEGVQYEGRWGVWSPHCGAHGRRDPAPGHHCLTNVITGIGRGGGKEEGSITL